jgi:secretion/DNA translocation related TadE-like protein
LPTPSRSTPSRPVRDPVGEVGREGEVGRAGSPERGSASIWLLCAGFVVITFGLVGALAAAAATARHRAQAAADLGALAGARYAVDGRSTACARAAAIVAANGATMTGCLVNGVDLVVTAELPVTGLGAARGTARAGPVGEEAGPRGPPVPRIG